MPVAFFCAILGVKFKESEKTIRIVGGLLVALTNLAGKIFTATGTCESPACFVLENCIGLAQSAVCISTGFRLFLWFFIMAASENIVVIRNLSKIYAQG